MDTLLFPTETKAKRQHMCDFCGQIIRVGEVYMKSTHKDSGDIYDWKTHKHCDEIANKLNMYDDLDDGLTQDMFVENISEKHDDILINQLPQDDLKKYSDIIQQIRYVGWNKKLSFVIQFYNRKEIL